MVEPGIVLDDLNRQLKPHGLWFPVDVSTASRATIGGMAATIPAARARCATAPCATTCSRSTRCWPTAPRRISGRWRRLSICPTGSPLRPLARDLLALGTREADEIEARFPKVQRRVGGYNLDAFAARRATHAQSRAPPARLGRHARLLHPHRAEALAAARQARRRRLPLRRFYAGDGRGAAPRQAEADRGRAGRPHHDRARRARSPCSARP